MSVITTAGLRRLAEVASKWVDPLRFRANLLVEVPGSGFAEERWLGQLLQVGSGVVLRARQPLTRCVMIDLAQEHVPEHGRLLGLLAEHHDLSFGVWATVDQPGRLAVDDPVRLVSS